MNEKIRQLAEQAGALEVKSVLNIPKALSLNGAEIERFAELIVRECMNICKEHPSRIVSNNWVADAVAPDIVSQFEEHFGVEE